MYEEGNQEPASPSGVAVGTARALLGVTPDAGVSELTRAYWRRARCLHPDLSPDPEATQQFQALHAAYRVALDAVRHGPPPASGPNHGAAAPGSARVGATATRPTEPVPPRPTTSRPRDGVWVVAGPVRVQPARHVDVSGNSTGARP